MGGSGKGYRRAGCHATHFGDEPFIPEGPALHSGNANPAVTGGAFRNAKCPAPLLAHSQLPNPPSAFPNARHLLSGRADYPGERHNISSRRTIRKSALGIPRLIKRCPHFTHLLEARVEDRARGAIDPQCLCDA